MSLCVAHEKAHSPSVHPQKIRALVVGNSTLAHMYVLRIFSISGISCARVHEAPYVSSVKYGLQQRLIPHPAQAVTLRASAHIQGKACTQLIALP